MHVRQYCRTTDGGEEFAVPYLCDGFLQMEGSGKRRIEELMVVSPSSPSMSDSNHLMSLEVKQSVVIFLLFILPLEADKIKEEKLKLWRASLPSFFVLLSFYVTVVLLLDCTGTVTLYGIQGVSSNSVTKK